MIHGCIDFSSLRTPHISFVCYYFKTPNLTLVVLVKIHYDFNKFHFNFFKIKNKKILELTKCTIIL